MANTTIGEWRAHALAASKAEALMRERYGTLRTAFGDLLDAAELVPVKKQRSPEDQRCIEAFTEAIVQARAALRKLESADA